MELLRMTDCFLAPWLIPDEDGGYELGVTGDIQKEIVSLIQTENGADYDELIGYLMSRRDGEVSPTKFQKLDEYEYEFLQALLGFNEEKNTLSYSGIRYISVSEKEIDFIHKIGYEFLSICYSDSKKHRHQYRSRKVLYTQ